MSAVTTSSTPARVLNPAQAARSGAIAAWRELPRLLLVGVVWCLLLVPPAVGVTTGQAWLAAFASFPIVLASSGAATVGAKVRLGERPRAGDLLRVDAVVAVLLTTSGGLGAIALTGGGWSMVPGAFLVAATLMVGPFMLGYGAVRDRRGFAAIRGGVLIALLRPGWALSLLALGVLGAFGAVASLGVLALPLPGLLGTIGATMTAQLIEFAGGKHLGMPTGTADNRLMPRQRHTQGRHPESFEQRGRAS